MTQRQSLTLSMLVATVERKNSLLRGRNLLENQTQSERPSAEADWGSRRQKQRYRKRTLGKGQQEGNLTSDCYFADQSL